MPENKITEYFNDIQDTWKIFKELLMNYKPTDKYLESAARWLTAEVDDTPFRNNLMWIALSELYRLKYAGDPFEDIILLSNQAKRVKDRYGVSVQIRIKDKNGTVREMEG